MAAQSESSDLEFSGNYMILRPHKASVCDLFRILICSKKLEAKAFFELPPGDEKLSDFLRRRSLIFMSLFLQKLLLLIALPMKWCGCMVETWLNFLSWCFKCLRCKGPESYNCVSIIGHMDTRVELDKNLKPGKTKYNGALAAMASKITYESETFVKKVVKDHWKMEFIACGDYWNDYHKRLSTGASMFYDKGADMIVVAFRGTKPFKADNWCTDVDISWYELDKMGTIHGGFMKALGLVMGKGWPREHQSVNPLAYYTIREKLREWLNRDDKNKTKFLVTGHSLGGALAILFVAVLALHEETELLKRLDGVYTFGQPRVGDECFKDFMEKNFYDHGVKYLRYVYSNDVITRLPTDDSTFLYKHFGTCIYINSCYNGEILEEQPHRNVCGVVFACVPRFLNAIWELIRSFILPCWKGREYRETWLLTFVRVGAVFGFPFPGLADHNPQDYVNATRLVSEKVYRCFEDSGPELANNV